MKRHQKQLLALHVVQLADDQLLAIPRVTMCCRWPVNPCWAKVSGRSPYLAAQQRLLLAVELLERHLVGVEHLTLLVEQQAALIHVVHQAEEDLVDPVRQAARVEQLGDEDAGDVLHIVAHLLQVVVEAGLLPGLKATRLITPMQFSSTMMGTPRKARSRQLSLQLHPSQTGSSLVWVTIFSR